MSPLPKKIRIKDIAEKAGVSIGTVDRVLHNRGEVKEDTRIKVMDIVNRMGYTPNLYAKSLSSKKVVRLAVLIPNSTDNNPYWHKPLEGIQRGAEEIKGFNTAVNIFTFNATEEESYKQQFEKLLESEPDGVIYDPVFKEASAGFIDIMDEKKLPYIYVDTDIDLGNKLAYYGQNAKDSGIVAAKILSNSFKSKPKILIVKLANHKVISHHVVKRVEGFQEFFKNKRFGDVETLSVEIDLLQQGEPDHTVTQILNQNTDITTVFVPNSRVYRVAKIIQNLNLQNLTLIGYDLLDENVTYLKNGVINYLIAQKPEEQGYLSVMALFNYLVLNKEINKQINYSAIDIIIKENINYYQ